MKKRSTSSLRFSIFAIALSLLATIAGFNHQSASASKLQSAEPAINAATAIAAQPQDAYSCIDVYNVKRGDSCNSRTSVSFRLRNTCSTKIDMKYCAEKQDGRWSCGMWSNTSPNESTSWYICDGTGRYRYWARVSGSNVRFPPNPSD